MGKQYEKKEDVQIEAQSLVGSYIDSSEHFKKKKGGFLCTAATIFVSLIGSALIILLFIAVGKSILNVDSEDGHVMASAQVKNESLQNKSEAPPVVGENFTQTKLSTDLTMTTRDEFQSTDFQAALITTNRSEWTGSYQNELQTLPVTSVPDDLTTDTSIRLQTTARITNHSTTATFSTTIQTTTQKICPSFDKLLVDKLKQRTMVFNQREFITQSMLCDKKNWAKILETFETDDCYEWYWGLPANAYPAFRIEFWGFENENDKCQPTKFEILLAFDRSNLKDRALYLCWKERFFCGCNIFDEIFKDPGKNFIYLYTGSNDFYNYFHEKKDPTGCFYDITSVWYFFLYY